MVVPLWGYYGLVWFDHFIRVCQTKDDWWAWCFLLEEDEQRSGTILQWPVCSSVSLCHFRLLNSSGTTFVFLDRATAKRPPTQICLALSRIQGQLRGSSRKLVERTVCCQRDYRGAAFLACWPFFASNQSFLTFKDRQSNLYTCQENINGHWDPSTASSSSALLIIAYRWSCLIIICTEDFSQLQ